MFRFTTRDLLWLTVVVALACGWWINLAKNQAIWRSERRQIFAEWSKQRSQDSDFRQCVLIAISRLPTSQRDELFRTIYGTVEPAIKQKPPTPNRP